MREILTKFLQVEIARIFYMIVTLSIGTALCIYDMKDQGVGLMMLVAGAAITRFRTPKE